MTTNRVAELAGVSVGTLYQYFPNKDALVVAVVDRHIDETFTPIRARAPTLIREPVARAIRCFVDMMLESHSVEPKLHRALAEQLPRIGAFRKIEATLEEGAALARTYLEAHRDEIVVKDLDVAAFIVVHTIESLTHATVLSRPELLDPGRDLAGEITACIVRYLTVPG